MHEFLHNSLENLKGFISCNVTNRCKSKNSKTNILERLTYAAAIWCNQECYIIRKCIKNTKYKIVGKLKQL